MGNIKVMTMSSSQCILLLSVLTISTVVQCTSTKSPKIKMSFKSIDSDELVKYQADPKALIVDVREVNEIAQTGILPGAINIPLAKVEDALGNLDSENFKTLYGKDKPAKDGVIVFSCRSGARSAKATETAVSLGFTNAINYSGGWLGWSEYIKKKDA